jgi:hypothetical protein
MPGAGNTIPFNSTRMQNRWRVIGDWDTAIADDLKLYK